MRPLTRCRPSFAVHSFICIFLLLNIFIEFGQSVVDRKITKDVRTVVGADGKIKRKTYIRTCELLKNF